jgi:hypothetical protein
MAVNSLGWNIVNRNPYTYTVLNGSGTITTSTDVQLMYDTTKVTTRQDLVTVLEQMLLLVQDAPNSNPFGPP